MGGKLTLEQGEISRQLSIFVSKEDLRVFILTLSLDHFRISLVKEGTTQEPAKSECELDKTEIIVEREDLKLCTASAVCSYCLNF